MNELLQIAARALDLDPDGDCRIEGVLPTHARSNVVVIATRFGERVIAKQFLGSDAELRFEAELTALRALSNTAGPVPRLRGEDRQRLVLVETAVNGPTVEVVIRGTDRDDAERQLVRYATAIGRLHLAGRDAVEAIGRAREMRGYAQHRFWPPFGHDARGAAAGLAALSQTRQDRLADEVAAVVARTFEVPGAGATLIQWDNWPGNAIATIDQVVLVDLENSMLGAPLIDVSSWHLSFPAAPLRLPLAGLIPDALIARMDRAYVEATGRAIDPDELAFAVANRMLFELTAPSAGKLVSGALDEGIRAIYVFRLTRAVELLRQASVLSVLATTMAEVALKAMPIDTGALPQPYPALVS